jgi:hypothetical protein
MLIIFSEMLKSGWSEYVKCPMSHGTMKIH